MSDSSIIPWKTRPDLSVVELGGEREQAYAVNDVISNEFFRFGEVEYHILKTLRIATTVDGLKQAIVERFGFALGTEEIASYLNHLAADNLLVASGYGDGARLFQQHRQLSSGNRWQRVMGLLSFKLPGFYPGPLLSALSPLGRLLFNPVSIFLATICFLATLLFSILSWQVLVAKAPGVSELLSVEHLFLITVGFVIAKFLHELGHGLACRQMGHECSEMGVLLLVMIPCLYCDVSDLWNAKSRYKRILVSLAGIFIELLLATVCFWGWYFSLDGTVGRFLFSMMLVTSLNTLFVNGNPLMRYDGYYAISDFFGVPNLAAKSQQCLSQDIDGFFFKKDPVLTLHQQTGWLKLYAVGSFLYRWLIMGAIGWMAWTFFESQQLLAFGRIIVGSLVVLAVLPLLLSLRRYWGNAWNYGLRGLNTGIFLLLLGAVVWIVSQIEFEHRVSGIAKFQLANGQQVFAPASGAVVPRVFDGQLIEKGMPIGEVIDENLFLEKLVAQQQADDVAARLSAMKLSDETRVMAAEIEFWKKRQASWRRKLNDIEDRIGELSIVAPRDGRFIVQAYPAIDSEQAEERLQTRAGNWTDSAHRKGFVERGENLGYVAPADLLEGSLTIPEKDISLVKKGQVVRVFVPFGSEFLVGKVTRISLENQEIDQPGNGTESLDASAEGAYNVEFQFPYDERVRVGASRKSVILCRKTSVLQWTTRWIYNAFWL